MTCPGGDIPKLAAGYTIPTLVSGDSRRRSLSTINADGTEVIAVFRCHEDMELAALRCPADPEIPGKCAAGYTGYLCNSCEESFGMSTKRICELCDDTGYTMASLGMLLVLAAVVTILIFLTCRTWQMFSLKHLARCMFQPGRILITYSQVTSQLGDVLDFTYPGLFGEIIEFLRPVMDLWGLLFRALGPSECYGIKGFTAKWLLRIVAMPLACGIIILGLYMHNRTRLAESALCPIPKTIRKSEYTCATPRRSPEHRR